MKYLPLKLAIFVLLLFAVVIATCLLWTPVKVRYYTAKLKSNDPKERVKGVDGLLSMAKRGEKALVANFPDGEEAANFLIGCWKDVNEEKVRTPGLGLSYKPIHAALPYDSGLLVELVIAKGAAPDETAKYVVAEYSMSSWQKGQPIYQKYSPLEWALQKGYEKAVEGLINMGAVVKGKRDSIWLASAKCSARIGKLLMEKGVNPNGRGFVNMDSSPLMLALRYKNSSMALFLIRNGAQLDLKSDSGWAILSEAVRWNMRQVAELLIQKGADVNAISAIGVTPLDVAYTTEMQSLLRARGAMTGKELRKEAESK